jgi:ubiquinone/menaquinone biosynthesis C-methylase UbiE
MNETPNTHMAGPFNAMVGAYETWAEPLSVRPSQVALGRTTVSAGDFVLDIGAGRGALSLQAAALGARVTAIDLSSAMVARLNQRLAPYPECKVLVMDGEALTFEDSTFDAAFSVLSTTLFSNWSAGLDEAVRVVRPGGWLGIVHWANPEGADIFTILSRVAKGACTYRRRRRGAYRCSACSGFRCRGLCHGLAGEREHRDRVPRDCH